MAPSSSAPPRSVAGIICFWLAVAGLLLGAFALAGGSFAFAAGPLRVSLRNPINPLLATILFGGLALYLLGVDPVAQRAAAIGRFIAARGPWLALGLAVAVLAVAVERGAFVAGGADGSGYLNEARLWRDRNFEVPVPLASEVRLPGGAHPWAPLGFRAARDRDAITPVYPPGLPIAMSLANRLAGDGAEFSVVPLCAAGLVLVTYAFGRRIAGGDAALLGAAATASSPILLFQALQPMSDVPAAFCWMLALLLLTWSTRGAAFAAGAAAALAALIRPNLFALAPSLALVLLFGEGTRRERIGRAALLSLAIVPAALLFLDWERDLYGSATQTGYGAIASLFSASHIATNVPRYGRWLIELHTPVLLLAAIAPVLVARGYVRPLIDTAAATRAAWGALFVFLALVAFYMPYMPFDNWPFARFFLPVLPAILTLAFLPVAAAITRLAGRGASIVLLVLLLIVPTASIGRAERLEVFRLADREQRFPETAARLSALPHEAVLLSMFHSGSIFYYTGRPTLRWDWLEADALDSIVHRLESAGHAVFVVLDDTEEPQFRSHFTASPVLERMHVAGTVTASPHTVTIYELRPRAGMPTLPH